MKTSVKILLIIIMSAGFQAFAQSDSNAIVGIWKADKGTIQIIEEDGRYIGYPIKEDGSRATKIQVLNVKFNGNKWIGTLKPPDKDELLNVECEIEDSHLLLEARKGFFSKDLKWRRLE